MAHPNARTTPRTRAEMVKLVKAGHSQSEVARIYSVSRPTVAKWVWVYDAEGPPGLQDHSSRPHHSPRVTPEPLQETICLTRQETNWGPNRIAWALGVPCSTVYAVLRRAGLHRRPKLPRDTHKIVRYEHERPGDLVHLDIKKLGRVPPGRRQALRSRLRRDPQRAPALPLTRLRLPPRRRRRLLPLHLRRGAPRRARPHRSSLPRTRDRPLRLPRRPPQARPHRQRRLLPQPLLPRNRRRPLRPTQAHPTLPTADQREGRGIHQDPPARVGLSPPLHLQHRTPRGPRTLPLGLQPPPTTRRPQRQHSRLPPVNHIPGPCTESAMGPAR